MLKDDIYNAFYTLAQYCQTHECNNNCEFKNGAHCMISYITGSFAPCSWKVDNPVCRPKPEPEPRYMRDFRRFCEADDMQRHKEALDKWYWKNFGCSREEVLERRYESTERSKRSKRRYYGDENFLWFNPNEFEGF